MKSIKNKKELQSYLKGNLKAFAVRKISEENYRKIFKNVGIEISTRTDFVACTDSRNIMFSENNDFKDGFFEAYKNRFTEEKISIIYFLGLLAHEVGHIFYTDFKPCKNYLQKTFLNILEDGYIEKKLLESSHGIMINSLKLLREYQKKGMDKFEENVLEYSKLKSLNKKMSEFDKEEKEKMVTMFLNELLLFAKYDILLKESVLEDMLKEKAYKEDYIKAFEDSERALKQEIFFDDFIEYFDIKRDVKSQEESNGQGDNGPQGENSLSEEELEEILDNILDSLKENQMNPSQTPDKDSVKIPKNLKESIKEDENISSEKVREKIKEILEKLDSKESENSKEVVEKNEESNKDAKINENAQKIILDEKHQESESEEELISQLKSQLRKETKELEAILYDKIFIERNCIEITDKGREDLKSTLKKHKREIKKLESYLKDICPEEIPWSVSGSYSGRLDKKNLGRKFVKGEYDFFEKKIEPTENPQMEVFILLDESGSMIGENLEKSRAAMTIIKSSLDKIGVKNYLFGHTTKRGDSGWHEVVIHEYDTLERMYSFPTDKCYGNIDYEALKHVLDFSKKKTSSIKMVFVISDGLPCGYQNEYRSLIKNAPKDYNVLLFGTGIGSVSETVESFFDKTICVKSLDLFPKEVLRKVKKYLR